MPWPAGAKPIIQTATPDATPTQDSGGQEPSLLQKIGSGLNDAYTGAAKGLEHTLGGLGNMVTRPFVSPEFAKSQDSYLRATTTPKNTAESIGNGVEQTAEFLAPGGAEEKGAVKLAELAPQLGKWAKPLARVMTSGVAQGAVNKAQGGSFAQGALMGGAGEGLVQAGKAVAPKVAETALNIRKLDRAYKEPGAIGRAILDETKGFSPGSVAESAQGKLDRLNPELDNTVNQWSFAPSASLNPARSVIDNAAGKAYRQGERTTLSQLQPMSTHLGEDIAGNPISQDVTPRELLDLKRGFGNEFIHRWNPETMEGVKGTAARGYHAMAKELNATVPGAKELNSRIGSLIPVAKRGESAELNAPTVQKVFNRVGAHTGALAGGVFGAHEGFQRGGVPGAIAGGAAGLILPEMIASPTGEMLAARTLNSGAGRVPLRAATRGTLRMLKPDDEDENEKAKGAKK